MHLSTPFFLRFPPLLLQAVEAAKVASEAAGAVTKHAADSAFTALLWLGLVLAVIVAVWQFIDARRERKAKDEALAKMYAERADIADQRAEAVKAALQEARAEWAKQQAFDNGHAADMLHLSREAEREAWDRIDDITKELRLQDKESVKVIASVSAALTNLIAVIQGQQFQLITIETILTGRPPQTQPLRPPAISPPSSL